MTIAFGPDTDFLPAATARQLEARAYRGVVKLFGRRVAQPPVSAAVPAVLVPGFISGDVSLRFLSHNLRLAGHRTYPSGIGANLGCTDEMVQRLLRRVEQVAHEEGRRVAVVGHSRGGMVAKIAAVRRPDLVHGLIALTAPVTGTLSVAPHVRKQLEVLFRLNQRGWRSIIGADCVTGACAERVVELLEAPWPAAVAYTSVYSRSDAIIDWRTCLDPSAVLVEVSAAHSGAGTDPEVLRVVLDRLAEMSRVGLPAG